ncbi:MAG: type II toxin-antitoxin system RelE/ParE family toxin [Candidatus Micrarchaeota archaeon]
MRNLHRSDKFEADIKSLDNSIRLRAKDAVDKIQKNPELGKPLRHELAGLFSEHFGGWRIIYGYDNENIYLLSRRKRKAAYK